MTNTWLEVEKKIPEDMEIKSLMPQVQVLRDDFA